MLTDIPSRELKKAILSYIEESKTRMISHSTSFEESVQIADELISGLKKFREYIQHASSKLTYDLQQFYVYLSELASSNDRALEKFAEAIVVKLRSMEIEEEMDNFYKEYTSTLQANRSQRKTVEDREEYKKQIKDYAVLIRNIDKEFYEIRKLEEETEEADSFRLKLLLEDFKLKYLKIKKLVVEDSVYRSELERLKNYTKDESLLKLI